MLKKINVRWRVVAVVLVLLVLLSATGAVSYAGSQGRNSSVDELVNQYIKQKKVTYHTTNTTDKPLSAFNGLGVWLLHITY
ncbi:MAG: hypothetical protein AB1510_05550 [Bacillota bacterium]